jgi:transposase
LKGENLEISCVTFFGNAFCRGDCFRGFAGNRARAVHALIRAQHAEILRQNQALLSKDEQLLSRDAEIEHLKLLIAKLRREQFGRSSEKLDRQIAQLELRLGELEASRAKEETVECAGVSPVARPARRPLPEHLPREVRNYVPSQSDCPDCGRQMKHLGEDVSEMLEYAPERFKVIRHVRTKLVCIRCDRIVQAAAPSRPIERGIAGPGLLAHVRS